MIMIWMAIQVTYEYHNGLEIRRKFLERQKFGKIA